MPNCELLGPSDEHLFALDACDALENGEGGEPGTGEPESAFRQNDCVWEVNCGNNPSLAFSGGLDPDGADKAEWSLERVTPCELGFDEAGEGTGSCQVTGQQACTLADTSATAGDEECPAVIENPDFTARGCGDRGGTALECSAALQHGCNLMALCDSSRIR